MSSRGELEKKNKKKKKLKKFTNLSRISPTWRGSTATTRLEENLFIFASLAVDFPSDFFLHFCPQVSHKEKAGQNIGARWKGRTKDALYFRGYDEGGAQSSGWVGTKKKRKKKKNNTETVFRLGVAISRARMMMMSYFFFAEEKCVKCTFIRCESFPFVPSDYYWKSSFLRDGIILCRLRLD